MTQIFIDHESAGYPTDYIVSRLKGRLNVLYGQYNKIAKNPSAGPDYIRTSTIFKNINQLNLNNFRYFLNTENRWVYLCMNKKLKEYFFPYYLFIEMGTIFDCLRLKLYPGNSDLLNEKLEFSILSKYIKEYIKQEPSINTIIPLIEKSLTPVSKIFYGFKGTFKKNNLMVSESILVNKFYDYVNCCVKKEPLVLFFSSLIDSYNITLLYKSIWWSEKELPHFLASKNINTDTLKTLYKSNDAQKILHLIYSITKVELMGGTKHMDEITMILNNHILNVIKKYRLESLSEGYILYYLWSLYVLTIKISVAINKNM